RNLGPPRGQKRPDGGTFSGRFCRLDDERAPRRPRLDSTPVTSRTLVKNLAAATDGPVSVSGWVETVRDQKKVQFVILRDETGAVQLVHPRTDVDEPGSDPLATTISALTHGSFLTVTGELKHDERVKLGGLEVKIGDIEVTSTTLETPI